MTGASLKSGAALLYFTQNSFDVVKRMYIIDFDVGSKLTVLPLCFVWLGKALNDVSLI